MVCISNKGGSHGPFLIPGRVSKQVGGYQGRSKKDGIPLVEEDEKTNGWIFSHACRVFQVVP
jgi:hypothetical protein